MFLKTMELITTFNPELSSGHLLEVERKMAVTKKRSFERWVEKALRRREQAEQKERRRFDRERFWRGWSEWIVLDTTRQALVPLMALLVLAGGCRLVVGQSAELPAGGGDSRRAAGRALT